jgi:hypothetical protein
VGSVISSSCDMGKALRFRWVVPRHGDVPWAEYTFGDPRQTFSFPN